MQSASGGFVTSQLACQQPLLLGAYPTRLGESVIEIVRPTGALTAPLSSDLLHYPLQGLCIWSSLFVTFAPEMNAEQLRDLTASFIQTANNSTKSWDVQPNPGSLRDNNAIARRLRVDDPSPVDNFSSAHSAAKSYYRPPTSIRNGLQETPQSCQQRLHSHPSFELRAAFLSIAPKTRRRAELIPRCLVSFHWSAREAAD